MTWALHPREGTRRAMLIGSYIILTAQILDNVRRELNNNYPANLPGDLDAGNNDD